MTQNAQSILGHFLLTGIDAYRHRLWATALQHLSVALMILPKSATARFYRALVYERLGQYELALTEYAQACKDDPDYYPAWIACGKLSILSRQHYDQAYQAFQTAAQLAPREDRAQIGIAISSLCLNKEANITYAACQKAILLNPRNSNYYEVRAIASMRQGKFRKSLEDFHAAIDGNPLNLRLYLNRSSAYFELNELDKARRDLEFVIQRASKAKMLSLAHARLGVIHEKQGNILSAFVEFDRGFGHCPTSAELLICRAQALAQLSQFQAAIVDYNQAVLLEPGKIEWVFERMQLHYWKHDFEGCLKDASLVLLKIPEQGQAIYFQALAKAQLSKSPLVDVLKDLDQAIAIFEREGNGQWVKQAQTAVCLIKNAHPSDSE